MHEVLSPKIEEGGPNDQAAGGLAGSMLQLASYLRGKQDNRKNENAGVDQKDKQNTS